MKVLKGLGIIVIVIVMFILFLFFLIIIFLEFIGKYIVGMKVFYLIDINWKEIIVLNNYGNCELMI